jgi:3-dehydroquinate synthase
MTKANNDVYKQDFSVSFEYPVHFTHNVFDPKNSVLSSLFEPRDNKLKHRVMIYIDSGVIDATPGIVDSIKRYFKKHSKLLELVDEPQAVTGGEKAKTGWEPVQGIMSAIGDHHLCRQSYIVAIGGGSVLDMIGFAASLVHRGLRFIRIPTTVLAQNDAGVGVKNGMDEHGSKNFVGSFAPPFAVINDFEFLKTLDDKYWSGGIAEAFKVAIIKDKDFFQFLLDSSNLLRSKDMHAMERLVRRCAELHLEHIRTSGDPFEFGSARPLDFGHWSAHRIEVMSQYTFGHGQAVSLGIALDSFYAMRKKLISKKDFNSIIDGLTTCGLPIYDELLERRNGDNKLEILVGLDQFQEHLGGLLTITLPDPIGNRREVHEIDPDIVSDGIDFLKKLSTK